MDPIAYGLPHREPFIFIDSVEKLERGVYAESSKSFSGDEPFFAGHFPGNAIVPGVLLTEGMAQTAGIAVGGPDQTFLLTAIRSMKFMRVVRPRENIRFVAKKLGEVGGLVQCAVTTRVGDALVAEGELILARTEK
ncbi:MAG: 3-hydroxyacyl-ACP dehydratase FabZ family protein [Chthoniobacterales bacterium]